MFHFGIGSIEFLCHNGKGIRASLGAGLPEEAIM
jgi:hypothetical protein